VEPRFDKYIFIEKDPDKTSELEKLKAEFTEKSEDIIIVNEDANAYLQNLCDTKNWQKHRAVLFLDPFGMQIPWSTIELIAKTEAIDLWYLFPLGVAVNRLLKRDGNIKKSWRKRLDELFGTDDWYDAFYAPKEQLSLFDYNSEQINEVKKISTYESISKYFVKRLENIFPGVAENPLVLHNSCNTPLYLLCFAAANPKGAKTAIRIAQDILKK
ncbi:MAG: three-Cys-motif partner protein TcmP, partial [Spirulinaceae cyanobacterium]